jgi:excisionase family DNA binding protein
MQSKDQTTLNLGYYSVKEIASKIGFHPDTVYGWIEKRNMPIRRAGKRCRITVYWPEFIKWWQNLRND